MTAQEEIEQFNKEEFPGAQFTKEGIMLAIFKLTVQNHAMLNTLISMVARLYSETPMNPAIEELPHLFEELRTSHETTNKDLSQLYEQLSTKVGYDFAVEHDSSLNDDGDLISVVFPD